jgi:hypothetical protein
MSRRWVGAAITLVALWALVAIVASLFLMPIVQSVGPRETPTTYGAPGPTGGPAR